jgi:hypothetical protein
MPGQTVLQQELEELEEQVVQVTQPEEMVEEERITMVTRTVLMEWLREAGVVDEEMIMAMTGMEEPAK